MRWMVAGVSALIAVMPVLAQDVSGTWQASVDLDIGSGDPVFVFTQDGEKLQGTYDGTFGGAELTGTMTGDRIAFTFSVQDVGTASYTGTVSGDTMKGTCDYGPLGGGSWEAVRVDEP